MELVYLWVDSYKNIENQGFNFSSMFECKYDEDKHELTIDEKKDYVSIFPDNINITAIVGENGSGKSSVLDDILNSFIAIDFELCTNKNLLIFHYKGKLYKKHSSEFIIENISKEIKIYTITDKETSHIEIIKNLDILKITNKSIKTIYKDKNEISPIENKYTENYINKIIIINTQHKYLFKEIVNNFFLPIKLIISVKEDLLKEYANRDDKFKEDRLKKIDELKYKSLFDKIKIIIEIFQINNDGMDNPFDTFEMKYKIESNIIEEIPNLIKENKKTDYEINIKNINVDILKFIEELPNILDIDFITENGINFNELSYGEKQILTQLHIILYHSHRQYSTIEDDRDEKITSNLILIDELELGLHPNWQKATLKYIIDILNKINKKFHLVITSHSPFILSDLPKENVIFLKEGKQVNPDINTFGANIHTLLSHGFFMSGGLMGEFAKDKIDEVIELLNSPEKLTDKGIQDCENIISITGEPIIKNQLRRMLDSKRLKKLDEIDKLSEEMELIKHRIEILRKNQ